MILNNLFLALDETKAAIAKVMRMMRDETYDMDILAKELTALEATEAAIKQAIKQAKAVIDQGS